MKNFIKKVSNVMNYGKPMKKLILFILTMIVAFIIYQVLGFLISFIYENLDGLTVIIILPFVSIALLFATQVKYPKDTTVGYSKHVKKYL